MRLLPALLLCLGLLPAPAAAAGLLDQTIFQRDDVSAFNKWTGMLERFNASVPAREGACPASPLMPCPFRDWQRFLDSLAGQDLMAQINAVNTRINFSLYVQDIRNWGVPDYWATPFEFMAKDGDCEDYAIAKYLTLKALGVDPAAMRIVVVDDMNLGIPHAVLTVQAGAETLVLDNQLRHAVSASAVHHYRAIYSINEQGWWLHRRPD